MDKVMCRAFGIPTRGYDLSILDYDVRRIIR